MKMKKRIIIVLIMAIFFGLVLSACEEEEINYGKLTVNNLPRVPSAISFGRQEYWGGGVFYDTDFSNYNTFNRYSTDWENMVASFENDISPFKLQDWNDRSVGFSKSGTFLVYIWPVSIEQDSSQYRAYMYVKFTNGNATIDFNDMIRVSTIPGY
jgi:hypothetical protein